MRFITQFIQNFVRSMPNHHKVLTSVKLLILFNVLIAKPLCFVAILAYYSNFMYHQLANFVLN